MSGSLKHAEELTRNWSSEDWLRYVGRELVGKYADEIWIEELTALQRPQTAHIVGGWAEEVALQRRNRLEFVAFIERKYGRDGRAARRAIQRDDVRLDELHEGEEEDDIPWHEMVPSGENVEETVLRRLEWDELMRLLTPQQRQVIEMTRRGAPQTDIAEELNVTEGRVSQLKAEALARLRGARRE